MYLYVHVSMCEKCRYLEQHKTGILKSLSLVVVEQSLLPATGHNLKSIEVAFAAGGSCLCLKRSSPILASAVSD